MFETFDSKKSRYASVGVVSSLPGELIDSIWYIIDLDLKGLIPLDNILSFDLMVVLRCTSPKKEVASKWE